MSVATSSINNDTHEFEVLGTKFKVDKKYQPLKALGKGMIFI